MVGAGARVNPFFILFLILRVLLGSKAGDSIRRRHFVLGGKILIVVLLASWITNGGNDLLHAAGVSDDDQPLLFAPVIWGGSLAALWLLPEWLAWRVLGPRGWIEVGRGLLLWATAGRPRNERKGAPALFSTVWAAEPPDLQQEDAGSWTAIALVIEAERRGDWERAGALASWIDHLPSTVLVSRRLRVYGIEHLARSAARGEDWQEVARRTRLGRGRGVRFLRRAAAARQGERGSSAALWRAWLLAPGRRESRAWRDAALAALAALPAEVEAVCGTEAPPRGTPWLEHLHLLETAAAGRSLPLDRVARLAGVWQGVLDQRHEAQWMARGLELEARAPAEVCREIRDRVLRELDVLVEAAQGPWPEDVSELAAELMARRRGLLLQGLKRWTAGFPSRGGIDRPIGLPLEEWTDWVVFHRHVYRLASCGHEALQTAWHSGLRLTACNWPVHLQKTHGPRSHWAACVMYAWSGWFAAWVGDDEIQRLSQSNLEIARKQLVQ